MLANKLSRRGFLRASAMAAVSALAASCAQPTPQVIEKPVTVIVQEQVPIEKQVVQTVVVEKPVTVEKVVQETVVVEKPVTVEKIVQETVSVEKVVTATPVSSSHESPMLQSLVNAGELPPLEERLPAEPLQIDVVDGIGQFGGTWQAAWLGMDYPWDAQQTGTEPLVRYTQDGGTVQPNLIKQWDVSSDGQIFTLYLRKGIKWSDGEPFTADDVMFYFDDVLANTDLTPVYPSQFAVGGERAQIEKVDDYTIRFSFAKAYGLFIFGALTSEYYYPKHYMQQFHPTYTSPEMLNVLTKNAKFEFWYQLFQARAQYFWLTNPDYPTVWPWRCTVPAPSTRIKWERNAYYWKVDSEGNQLPYIDGITWDLVQDTQVLSLKAMSGELDFAAWWLSTGDYTLYMENRQKGDFQVFQWSDTYGANPMVFCNQTVKDPALREIFRDVRFRQAISLALNRADINTFAYQGMGIPRQASLVEKSAAYSETWTNNYAEYNPDKANQLLDEMGLDKKDSSGYRLRKDGTTLAVTIEFAAIFDNYPDVIELVKEQWEAVGIKVDVKNLQRSLFVEHWNAGEYEIGAWTQPGLTVLFNNWWFFNNAGRWGVDYNNWYQSQGAQGEKPSDDLVRLYQIWDELQLTPDETERARLINEGIDIHIKGLYIIGIVGSLPKIVIVKNRLKNVPEAMIFDNTLGCPRNGDPEQFYIKA